MTEMKGVMNTAIGAANALGQSVNSTEMLSTIDAVQDQIEGVNDQVRYSCSEDGLYEYTGDDYRSAYKMSTVTELMATPVCCRVVLLTACGGLQAYFCLFGLNLLMGFIAYCCMKSCPSACMTVFAFLLLALSWALFGSFYFTAAFLDDTCIQLQLWYDCEVPPCVCGHACSFLPPRHCDFPLWCSPTPRPLRRLFLQSAPLS